MAGGRRRRRDLLLRELREGRRGRPLKPMEVVACLDELLALGERPSDLRPLVAGRFTVRNTPEVLELVQRAQESFAFDPRAWRILGIKLPRTQEEKRKRLAD